VAAGATEQNINRLVIESLITHPHLQGLRGIFV
jgi:hypothetical protein